MNSDPVKVCLDWYLNNARVIVILVLNGTERDNGLELLFDGYLSRWTRLTACVPLRIKHVAANFEYEQLLKSLYHRVFCGRWLPLRYCIPFHPQCVPIFITPRPVFTYLSTHPHECMECVNVILSYSKAFAVSSICSLYFWHSLLGFHLQNRSRVSRVSFFRGQ